MLPLRVHAPRSTVPWVTWALLVTNLLVFGYELRVPAAYLGTTILPTYGLIPSRLMAFLGGSRAAPWSHLLPLLSSQFLHAGWLHVLGNMWMLFLFGGSVEDRLGHPGFVVFYLTCGLAAGLTQCLLQPHSTVPIIGASGAIAGVMGGFMVRSPRARVLTLIPLLFFWVVELPAWVILGYWFFLQALSGSTLLALRGASAEGGVAWFAHLGGFIAGAFLLQWWPTDP